MGFLVSASKPGDIGGKMFPSKVSNKNIVFKVLLHSKKNLSPDKVALGLFLDVLEQSTLTKRVA